MAANEVTLYKTTIFMLFGWSCTLLSDNYSESFRYTHACSCSTYHMEGLSQAMIHIEVILLGPVG